MTSAPGVCVQGLPAASLQWGAWGGAGMAVTQHLLPRIIKSGLGVLPPVRGVAVLASILGGACLGAPAAQLVVSPFEWPKLMAGSERVFPVRIFIYPLRKLNLSQ